MDTTYKLLNVLLQEWGWRTLLYRIGFLCSEHAQSLEMLAGQKENAKIWTENGKAIKDFSTRLDDTPGI